MAMVNPQLSIRNTLIGVRAASASKSRACRRPNTVDRRGGPDSDKTIDFLCAGEEGMKGSSVKRTSDTDKGKG